jgi:hypothetical protein
VVGDDREQSNLQSSSRDARFHKSTVGSVLAAREGRCYLAAS